MDRRPALLNMAAALSTACKAGDWAALAAADSTTARTVPALAARGRWTQSERAALLALRAAHAQAYHDCSKAKEHLGLHLNSMQENKEGWIAYALSVDADTE